MYHPRPAVPEFLLERSSGKVEPRVVDVSAKFVGASHPDEGGCSVGYQAEALFTFAKLLLV
jgi:hypothetical protein